MVRYEPSDNTTPEKPLDKICPVPGFLSLNTYPKLVTVQDNICLPFKGKPDTRVIKQCDCGPEKTLTYSSVRNSYLCDDAPRNNYSGSYRSAKPSKSWFGENKSWLFPMFAILIAGLVGYVAYSSQKKQIEKAADPFFVSNPSSTGLIPLPAPRTGTGVRN
jgi:hypothetical protein